MTDGATGARLTPERLDLQRIVGTDPRWMRRAAWFPCVCAEVPEGEAVRRKRSVLSKTKYTCPCGVNVWGKLGLRVVCAECEARCMEGA